MPLALSSVPSPLRKQSAPKSKHGRLRVVAETAQVAAKMRLADMGARRIVLRGVGGVSLLWCIIVPTVLVDQLPAKIGFKCFHVEGIALRDELFVEVRKGSQRVEVRTVHMKKNTGPPPSRRPDQITVKDPNAPSVHRVRHPEIDARVAVSVEVGAY